MTKSITDAPQHRIGPEFRSSLTRGRLTCPKTYRDYRHEQELLPVDPETWRDISAIFAALGDEHRQRILLTFEPGERLNVGQIAEVSTLARSTVSPPPQGSPRSWRADRRAEGRRFISINKPFLQDAFAKVTTYLDTDL